jgi:hypothetical protein
LFLQADGAEQRYALLAASLGYHPSTLHMLPVLMHSTGCQKKFALV